MKSISEIIFEESYRKYPVRSLYIAFVLFIVFFIIYDVTDWIAYIHLAMMFFVGVVICDLFLFVFFKAKLRAYFYISSVLPVVYVLTLYFGLNIEMNETVVSLLKFGVMISIILIGQMLFVYYKDRNS